MIKRILIVCAFVLFASAASGEFYQYTDKTGKLCFTDDISTVPMEQRDSLKKIKSVRQETKTVDASEEQQNISKPVSSSSTGKEIENEHQLSLVELDAIQTKLNETRAALQKERLEIETQRPKEEATNNEKISFSLKVEALNKKIAEYEKKMTVFNDQVKSYNAEKEKKSENKGK